MADLKQYEVEINGVLHTLQLSSEDAARYGASAVENKSRTPQNKGRTSANKE